MGLSKKINTIIAKTLSNERIQTRPATSPGAWLIPILPLTVLVTVLTQPVSHVYGLCAVFCGNLLLNSVVLFLHMWLTNSFSITSTFTFYSPLPVAISAIIYNKYLGLDILNAACHSVGNSLLYFESLPYLLKIFPKAFSFGEANIAAQTVSLFIYSLYARSDVFSQKEPPTADIDIISTIIQIVIAVIMIIGLIPQKVPKFAKYLALISGLIIILPLINFTIRRNCVFWMMEFICSHSRLRLVSWWAACSGLAWGTVVLQIRSKRKATTDVRKVFHLLAVLVFLSGVLVDPVLLYLATGLVIPLFFIIEFIRAHKLTPFWKALQDGFHVYADEKDAGGVALTPIYLLMGCSAPLWLAPNFKATLPLMAGVLSIGVGDSFASVVGRSFGKHKWSGSKKSVEGSIGCFIGQLVAILLLSSYGLLPSVKNHAAGLIKPAIAIGVNTLVEAKTDQVDNVILPLVTYVILVL